MPKESQYIKHYEMIGEARGSLRAARYCLLRAIEVRIQDPVPEPTRTIVESTTDLDKLDLWFEVALDSPSLADL